MAFNSYQYEFAGGDRTEQVKSIDFQNTLALSNVFRIKFFKEEDITGAFQKKEFRYSFDNAIWSNWATLTQQNVTDIQTRDNPDFYFQVRYTRTGIGAGNILRFYLFYDSDVIPPGPTPTDASIDADFLGGEPPSYYLDRANFFGPFLDLQAQNVVGPGAGVYRNRLDTSLGTTLYFKRIADSSTSTVKESSTGIITIETSGSATGTYDSALDPSVKMPDPVGGIPAGTQVSDLEGDALSELWDDLLFPTAFPDPISPSNSLSDNVSNFQEIGASLSITFTSGFNRGLMNPQYPPTTSPYRSGLPNTYTYTGAQIAGSYPSTSLSDIKNAVGYIVLQGNQSWQSQVSYDAGVQPYDSKGQPYLSAWPAGTTTNKTVTFEGVYPIFATTIDINILTKQSLISMGVSISDEYTLVTETGGAKQRFEIPDKWLIVNSLTGIQTLNTVSGNWEYQGGTETTSLTAWDTSSATEDIQGITEDYTEYTYNGDDRASTQIRLIF